MGMSHLKSIESGDYILHTKFTARPKRVHLDVFADMLTQTAYMMLDMILEPERLDKTPFL